MTDTAAEQCAHCSAELVIEDALYLWDGRWYCRGCVEGHSAALATYADEHACLTDTLTLEMAGGALRNVAAIVGAFATGVVFLWAFASFLSGVWDPRQMWFAIFLLPFAGIPAVFIFASLPQTIRIADGIVDVQSPLRTAHKSFAEWEWDLQGRLEDRSIAPLSRLLSRTPVLALRSRDHDYFACVDDDRRAVWMDFITLSAPQINTRYWGHRESRTRHVLNFAISSVLVGVSIFATCSMLSLAWKEFQKGNTDSARLLTAGTAVFVLGSLRPIWVIISSLRRWPW